MKKKKNLNIDWILYAFSILVFQEASIGIIGPLFHYHNHAPMFCHLLWQVWVILSHPWYQLTIVLWCCFLWKFNNFETSFAATCFMPKMSLKRAVRDSYLFSNFSSSNSNVIDRSVLYFVNTEIIYTIHKPLVLT